MGISGGRKLRNLRDALGIEDFELAEKTQIPLDVIRELEAGTRVAAVEEIRKIAFWLCPKNEELLHGLLVPLKWDDK